jgi:hypothetical protein
LWFISHRIAKMVAAHAGDILCLYSIRYLYAFMCICWSRHHICMLRLRTGIKNIARFSRFLAFTLRMLVVIYRRSEPWRWDREAVPTRRNIRRVTSQFGLVWFICSSIQSHK